MSGDSDMVHTSVCMYTATTVPLCLRHRVCFDKQKFSASSFCISCKLHLLFGHTFTVLNEYVAT